MKRNKIVEIIFEDNHLIAVNKPPGVLVQGDITGDEHLIDIVKMYLKDEYNKKGNIFCGLIHRLDRPTSGVVILAKTSKSLERMNRIFQNREVRKTYWAVVKNAPEKLEGQLTHYLKKNQAKNKSKAFSRNLDNAKKAVLSYKLLSRIDNYSLLEVLPQTGRHHQIRAQLSAIGCPIKGDLKYGFARTNSDGSIHLHARSLEFLHPVKKESILVTADPPAKDNVWRSFLKNLPK